MLLFLSSSALSRHNTRLPLYYTIQTEDDTSLPFYENHTLWLLQEPHTLMGYYIPDGPLLSPVIIELASFSSIPCSTEDFGVRDRERSNSPLGWEQSISKKVESLIVSYKGYWCNPSISDP